MIKKGVCRNVFCLPRLGNTKLRVTLPLVKENKTTIKYFIGDETVKATILRIGEVDVMIRFIEQA